jgi:pilus assembly protein CpaE
MAVIIVEPVEAGAAWLAHALAGLDQRILRTASPDEAMGAIATEGREVLAVLVGSGLEDEAALGLAARLQQAVPEVAVVLLRERESGQMLRSALRFGVRDVLGASSDADTVRASIARAIELATTLRGRLAAAAGSDAPEASTGRPGEIITVFSAKGGCGKTFLATNLAVALAAGRSEVALVDLDLHFGDVAIVLQLFPTRTIQDAARERGLDAGALRSYLTPHPAGVWALAAPTEPPVADTVSASAVSTILKLLRSSFAHVVVDTPAALTDQVLAAFDESDAIALLATLDVPSIKNLKLTMQTMERLRYPPSRIRVVVNRAGSRVGLRLPDVEKVLGTSVDLTIPSSRSVPISVNKGNPVLLEEPRGNVAEAIRRLAAEFAPDAAGDLAPPKSRRTLFQRS